MSISTVTYCVELSTRMDDGRWLIGASGTLDGKRGSYTIIDCPADLGDDVYAALDAEINDTDGDVTAYMHIVEIDGTVYRADVSEVGPDESRRYHVRIIESGVGIDSLTQTLATTHDAGEAKRYAESVAGNWAWGVAIVDTEAETIDWGDEVSDYAGTHRHDADGNPLDGAPV